MAQIKYNLGAIQQGIAVTELWSGSVGGTNETTNIKIPLNDDLANYKFLVFDFIYNKAINTYMYYYSEIISVQQFIKLFNTTYANAAISFCWGYSNVDDYFELNKVSTTKVLNASCKYTRCTRILGIN